MRHRVRLRTTRVVVSPSLAPSYTPTTVVISDPPTVRGICSRSCSTLHYYNIGFKSAKKNTCCIDHLICLLGVQNAVWGNPTTAGAQARIVLGALVSCCEHPRCAFRCVCSWNVKCELQIPVTVNTGSEQGGRLPAVTVTSGDLLIEDDERLRSHVRFQATRKGELKIASQGQEIDARCPRDIQSRIGVAESFGHHYRKM